MSNIYVDSNLELTRMVDACVGNLLPDCCLEPKSMCTLLPAEMLLTLAGGITHVTVFLFFALSFYAHIFITSWSEPRKGTGRGSLLVPLHLHVDTFKF